MKALVFGIGGVGCRILKDLSGSVPKNTEMIAIDREETQLDGLGENIHKIEIGNALAKCESFDNLKKALDSEIAQIEESLDEAGLALVIMSLGGKTGSFIGEFVAELCSERGIFTLVLTVYPLLKGKRGADEVDASVVRLQNKANGVIIIDNNLKRGDGKVPMLTIFKRVNSLIVDLILLFMISISGMGWMNLSKEELMHFFHGELFFLVTSGEGKNLQEAYEKSMDEIGKYAEVPHVRRILVLMSTPSEVSIERIKKLNSLIQEKLNPDIIKWISGSLDGDEVHFILIPAVSELPLVQGVKLPDEVGDGKGQEDETGRETESESAGMQKGEFGELPNMQLLDYIRDEEGIKSPALMGLSDKRKTGSQKPIAPDELKAQESEENEAESVREEAEENEEEEIEEIVNELVGFPSFKRKGQKRLDEYGDDMGIGYI